MDQNNEAFVSCDNLVKIYKVADLEVVALQGLDLEVNPGEILALVGPSGAGKSTLLNVIGGLDIPSAGKVNIGGWDLLAMKNGDRVRYKQETVGFVWQQPSRNLLPYLTAQENVELPMMIAGVSAAERRTRAQELLEVVGLQDRADFRPDRLSGGQQQRVALAVALSNNPPLLLGDELSGQIDTQSAEEVFETLRRINQTYQTTIILVTHDPLVSGLVDRVVAIRDGRTSTEIRRRRDKDSGTVLHEEEWVILDQAGRLQLPRAYMDKLGLSDRVKVRLEETHVTVWPEERVKAFIRMEGVPEEPPPVLKRRPYTRIPAVQTEGLSRTFMLGSEAVHALQDVNLMIPAGRLAVVKGRSGSGKTTLLNLIAGLDEPTAGRVWVSGQALDEKSAGERVEMRRHRIGFVFQTFGLLPFLSVEENVEVPLRMVHVPVRQRQELVREALELVGLTPRARHRTYELSGGEQQRAAIARALVNQPELILADEPTGQLDSATGQTIIHLLREIVESTGVTVVVASHDLQVIQAADLIYELVDGRLVRAGPPRREREPAAGREASAGREATAGRKTTAGKKNNHPHRAHQT
ncbi:MAG: ABC transporter ATP-binding protein [Anaerolineales bacterium]